MKRLENFAWLFISSGPFYFNTPTFKCELMRAEW